MRNSVGHTALPSIMSSNKQMLDIVVTGSHGLIGNAVLAMLASDGHAVTRLVRSQADPLLHEVAWQPSEGEIDSLGIDAAHVVIHLAGENLFGLWTKAKRRRIRESRVVGTRFLAETLANLSHPPTVFLSASAVGYYGDRGDATLTEASDPGTGFLAETCREWEDATRPAVDAGMRVVNLRTGIVLSRRGGAYRLMRRAFKLGLGAHIGSGRQYVSWVTLEDVVRALVWMIHHPVSGPVNVVAPNPVTNRDFTRAVGKAVRHPAVLGVPEWLARLTPGTMAEELVLASTRAVPTKLASEGFRFRHADISSALAALESE